MKRFFTALLFLSFPIFSFSQTQHDFLVATHLDVIKSDYDGYFQKAQGGVEMNYFFSRKFTVTAGAEYWTLEKGSLIIGSRWYPVKDAFIRARGLFGANDFSIGGGFAKPMTEKLRFESMADFYFEGSFSIRVGFAYLLRKEP
jgi:hypothetical protein